MQINYRYKELQYMHKLTMLILNSAVWTVYSLRRPTWLAFRHEHFSARGKISEVYESMVRFSFQNSTFSLVF